MDPVARHLSSSACTTIAVWRGDGRIILETAPLPTVGPGELLVRVTLATLCGSDRHTVTGRRAGACPSILGHEAVGVVEVAGEGALAAPGDRVVWGVTASCGECDRCLVGRTAKCRSVRKTGHEALDSTWPLSGGYAEHILLPVGLPVVRVPDAVPDAVAAPAACATATVMAALEQAGDLRGARVTVHGAGMLGLVATAAAFDRGAAEITVIDIDPERLATATEFGATSTSTPDDQAPPCDVALELSGAPSAVEAALSSLDVGGRAVLVGSVSPASPVPLDAEALVRGWQSVSGVHNYEPRHLHEAMRFLTASRDRWPWQTLVSDPEPLSHVGRLLTDRPGAAPRASVAPGLGRTR